MTQDTSSHAFHPTTTFPKQHVVGVINDLHEAEQVVQALHEAGYAAEHIHLFPSQAFITMFTEAQEHGSKLQRMINRLGTTTDEGFAGDWYLEEARQGHHVLAVYAANAEQVEQVRALLVKAHAHGIRYFGPWAVTNLPS